MARQTVVQVYERLVDEGYASARVGAGTCRAGAPGGAPGPLPPLLPAPALPDAALGPLGGGPAGPGRPREPWARTVPPSTSGPAFRTGRSSPRPLAPAAGPALARGRALAGPGALRRPGRLLAPAGGLAGYLTRSRGLRCTPEQVVVVSGSQQALDLLARVGLDPGDAAALEEPGYPPARAVLQTAGARLVPLAVDDGGW